MFGSNISSLPISYRKDTMRKNLALNFCTPIKTRIETAKMETKREYRKSIAKNTNSRNRIIITSLSKSRRKRAKTQRNIVMIIIKTNMKKKLKKRKLSMWPKILHPQKSRKNLLKVCSQSRKNLLSLLIHQS